MFCFWCKLIFEKKKKEEAHKAHMATKAHKLTLSFPTHITQDHSSRSFNEVHVGALLWLWIAHSQNLLASHKIKTPKEPWNPIHAWSGSTTCQATKHEIIAH